MPLLRPLTPADAPLLATVAHQAYCDHYLHLWHDNGEWYINRCFTPTVLEQELAEPTSRFFMIEQTQKPVGFLKINLDKPLAGQPSLNALELERIYLIATVTGQGIGRFVMDFVKSMARELGKELIWLKAMDSSREAIAFYQQNGFAVVGNERLSFETMKTDYRGMVVLQQLL